MDRHDYWRHLAHSGLCSTLVRGAFSHTGCDCGCHRFPPPPAGYEACRTILTNATLTHLIELDEHGSNGGRPTVCGLTRFDDRDPDGRTIPNTAGLPGWGLGDSGVTGPGVIQIRCLDCYNGARRGKELTHGAR